MKKYIATILLLTVIYVACAQTQATFDYHKISREDSIQLIEQHKRTTYLNATTGQKINLSDMQFRRQGDVLSITCSKDTVRILFAPGAYERIDSTARAFKTTLYGQPQKPNLPSKRRLNDK